MYSRYKFRVSRQIQLNLQSISIDCFIHLYLKESVNKKKIGEKKKKSRNGKKMGRVKKYKKDILNPESDFKANRPSVFFIPT